MAVRSAARPRIAFLLSGSGSSLANLLARLETGQVHAEVAVVVSDRADVGGLAIARRHGIDTVVVDRKAQPREAYGQALWATLKPYAPELVVLGGFLWMFPLIAPLEGRMVNVHPSLLPAFGGPGHHGLHVHRKVLARGCRYSGCTVHFVNDEVDGGPIVDQQVVEVLADDTPERLAARVQAAERELYPRAIEGLLRGTLRLEGRSVIRTRGG